MDLVLIAHNIRSTHNVGSILRSADGFGVKNIFFTGYTPYPLIPGDKRLPHIWAKTTKQISKTALGAEKTVKNSHESDILELIKRLKNEGYLLIALEQDKNAILLPKFRPKRQKIALLLGEEVHGIENNLLKLCDQTIEIPMQGKKESFNVSVATGIALYALNNA